MAAEIYYFSGTGNSLYIAKELQKRLPGAKLIPVVSLLSKEVIETNSEMVGFVFPVHLARLPVAMRQFLENIRFRRAEYIFAVATRIGSTHRAFIDIDNILKKKGKKLDASFNINMPGNDPKFKNYIPPTASEIKQLESRALVNLDTIQKTIVEQKKHMEKDRDATLQFPAWLLNIIPFFTALAEYTGMESEFYADSKCTGCGTCAQVCLSRKIKIADNKPVWQKDIKCFNCYACLNYCPKQAVQMKSSRFMKLYTEENSRYSHPYATANDIAGQK